MERKRTRDAYLTRKEIEIIRTVEETLTTDVNGLEVRIQLALSQAGFSRDIRTIRAFLKKNATSSNESKVKKVNVVKCGAARVLGLHRLSPDEAGDYLTEMALTILEARNNGEDESEALVRMYPEARMLLEMNQVAEDTSLQDFFVILLEVMVDGGDMRALAYELQV